LLLGLFVRRYFDELTAIASLLLISVCPLFISMHRLATTDGLLGLCVLITWIAGFRYTNELRSLWLSLFLFVVLASTWIKGPASFVAVLPVLLWAAWAGSSLRPALRLTAAAFAAVIPILVWYRYIVYKGLDVWSMSRFELLDRASGTGDHVRPWWFMLAVFLAALLPATLYLTFRPLGPWKHAAAEPKGRLAILLLGLIGSYLIIFSLFSGKLPSYLLPIAAPTAALAAIGLTSWQRKLEKSKRQSPRPCLGALVVAGGCSAAAGGLIAGVGVLDRPFVAALVVACLMLMLAGLFLAATDILGLWRRAGIAIAYGLSLASILAILQGEMKFAEGQGWAELTEHARELSNYEQPRILTVGWVARPLGYTTDQSTKRIDPRFTAAEWTLLDKGELVLAAIPEAWLAFDRSLPGLLEQRYDYLGRVHRNVSPRRIDFYAVKPEFHVERHFD
jgi:4-amino-4-deoxy-L-arabinose transferase-like glycosyltransferase